MTTSDYHAKIKREKGKYRVYTPDRSYVPCNCERCIGESRKWLPSFTLHDTIAQAIEFANYLGFREVEIAPTAR